MREYLQTLLTDRAHSWGLSLSAAQSDQFLAYADELRCWNERFNLTTITDPEQIVTRHFLDSLVCALHWGDEPQSLVDIGSGAGFPGLPLKILRPTLHLTLIESVRKKADFLHHIVELLGLEHVDILNERVELIGRDPHRRASYDVATARAVAELRVLAEYALPLLRVGGRLLAPKGADITTEAIQAQAALHQLGGRLHTIKPVLLPDIPPRALVVILKTSDTPVTYPRAVGVPARRPLSST
jgi:16S rRNA (guanine527-N7)-methyltransferase